MHEPHRKLFPIFLKSPDNLMIPNRKDGTFDGK